MKARLLSSFRRRLATQQRAPRTGSTPLCDDTEDTNEDSTTLCDGLTKEQLELVTLKPSQCSGEELATLKGLLRQIAV